MKEKTRLRVSGWKANVQRPVMMSLLLGFTLAAAAQSKVTGQVTDASGEPIIGASVMVKGSNHGSITDIDGNFTIQNVPDKSTLVITYVGFQPQEVKATPSVKVTLREDNKLLDEIVVVGYGTQRKADVTGATARVSSETLNAMPVKSALEGMQGKMAGVDIQSASNPGDAPSIQVRGVRSLNADQGPLYVVDGMIMQNGGIENINPQDIESIDVLKDAASTSVYGSRGANGVILVTTKHGKEGKLSVNYSGTLTLEELVQVAKMMTASEWLDYARMAFYNSGSYKSSIGTDGKVIPVYDQDKSLFGTVDESWANVDQAWVDGVYDATKVGSYDWAGQAKRTGVTHEHTISFSGGSKNYQGYGSFGYLNQQGSKKGQDYERFTMNVSFDAQVLPYLKLGTTINGTYGRRNYQDYYGAMLNMLPWTVPYDANGDNIKYPNGDSNVQNPIDNIKYNINRRRTSNITGKVYANVDFGKVWAPLDGLKYTLQFGPEFKFIENGTFYNALGLTGDGTNRATLSRPQYRSWVLDNIIQYNKTIADVHHIGVTLVQSANKYHYDTLSGSNTNVATGDELWYNLGSSTDYTVSSGLTETSMASYMARLTYNYAGRYLLTASVRRDGASQLAEGRKWATFPSVSLAWRIDQEKFMEPTANWLSSLKLRVGYGVSGNSAISAYATKAGISQVYYMWDDQPTSTGYLSAAANKDLGWERTGQWNVGLDFGFLNNRIYGSFDYYHTKTTDLLLSKALPTVTGFSSIYDNVGSTVGHGFDVQINAIPVKTHDFTWDLGLTWSSDRSYIAELANGMQQDVANAWFVGKPIGVFYDYVYDGVWKNDETVTLADGTTADASTYGRKTGQIKVKDLNGDGKIDGTNDRTIVGHTRPDWSGGLTSTFKYKNWDLSFFIYSRWGYTFEGGAMGLSGRYMSRSISYFVAGYNEDADYYAPSVGGDTYYKIQNYNDGSFIKMRNINLGYTFSRKQLANTKISNLKVYVQLMNPFMIYKATDWYDADLSSSVTNRSFVLGVNIGF